MVGVVQKARSPVKLNTKTEKGKTMEKAPTLEELRIEREKLDKQIAAIEVEEKRKVLAQVRELVSKAGLTAEDIFGHAKKGKSASSSPAKYRHPDNPALTWTGVGRKPKWLTNALAGGKTLEAFAI